MAGPTIVPQEELESRAIDWSAVPGLQMPPADPNVFNGLDRGDMVLILLDCSGSAAAMAGDYRDLALALGADAAAAGRRVAVYGYSQDMELFEFKRASSDSWRGLDAIATVGYAGTATGEALAGVAKLFFTKQEGVVLVITDGPPFDHELFSAQAEALRGRGVQVGGLVYGSGSQKLSGDDWADISADLPEALRRARRAVAGWLGQELVVDDYRVRQVRSDPKRPQDISLADGIFDLNSPGQQGDFSARYSDGRWLLFGAAACIEGINLSHGMEIRDFAVVAALQQARSKYLAPPELSSGVAAPAAAEPAPVAAPSHGD